MKRFLILLGILPFFGYSHAQTLEADSPTAMTDTLSVSPAEVQHALAEAAFARYFEMKGDQTVNKDQLYQTLMDCFKGYVKCMENADKTQLDDIKEKLRKLRPEFEAAGIILSSSGNNKLAYKYLECYLNIPELPIFEGERFPRNEQYPAYVFIVAAESHNSRDYEAAVLYLREYIELGEKKGIEPRRLRFKINGIEE